MPSHVASALVGALAALSTLAGPASASPCVVPKAKLAVGTYVGAHSTEYNQDNFLGIPYAKPPVGPLRFAAPEPFTESFSTPRNATQFGWMCIGYGSDTTNLGSPVNEDCLTLNVVRPRGVKSGDDLPVGVWVHGGSYVTGGSRDPRYDLGHIVEQSVREGKPMVAVSINYRLQNWGFLFGQELKDAGAGNIAFRDQRLALKWLQENIAAFGGNSDKVTIWGESAGARSLGMQLIAYDGKSDGLFSGAILQSGSPVAPFRDAAAWQPYFDALVERTGCSDDADRLACLRALPWQTLNVIFNGSQPLSVTAPTLSAVIDDDFMTGQAVDLLAQGKFAHVPLLTGNNFDEGTAYAKSGINTDDQWTAWLKSLNLNADQIAALSLLYPDDPTVGIPAESIFPGRPSADSTFGLQFKRSAALAGDYQQHAGRRALTTAYAAAGLPVYSYLWNVIVNGLPAPIYGATHFQEVAFVFNNVKGTGYAASPFAGKPQTYVELADLMSKMWVAFIHDSNPNLSSELGLEWPRYTGASPNNLVFDTNQTGLRYIAKDDDRPAEIAYLLESVF
ncbi:lipase [Plectosphaerella plurivora]|uniref:Carboxylic ester hydrolase n=1 Tax=Plectosphaerella plurivora TaxID=936078 RepID=A0A9P8V4M3_9PEZI|nr:lipase [Plectosphaerella plurivora]